MTCGPSSPGMAPGTGRIRHERPSSRRCRDRCLRCGRPVTSWMAGTPTPGRPRNSGCPPPAAPARSASPGSTRLAAGGREIVGPATPGNRLRVQTIRAGTQALKRFSEFLSQCQPPVTQPSGHRPGAARAVPRVAGVAAAGRLDEGAVPGVPAVVPGRQPALPLGARHPGRGDHRPRRDFRPAPLTAPVRPRVRDEPAGVRRQPRPATPALPRPGRADHRDGTANRGRLRVAVRPGAHRQRRPAVPGPGPAPGP